MKSKTFTIFLTVLIIGIFIIEPTYATDGSQIENINWGALLSEIVNIIADLFEEVADLLRKSAEVNSDLYNESTS